MKTFLAQAGIAESEYHFVDGSGLSRLTLVTPAAITKLLVHMYRSRYRSQWIGMLPVAGVDGTLGKRSRVIPRRGPSKRKPEASVTSAPCPVMRGRRSTAPWRSPS